VDPVESVRAEAVLTVQTTRMTEPAGAGVAPMQAVAVAVGAALAVAPQQEQEVPAEQAASWPEVGV
jgi:hypothetical protein